MPGPQAAGIARVAPQILQANIKQMRERGFSVREIARQMKPRFRTWSRGSWAFAEQDLGADWFKHIDVPPWT